MKQRAPWIALVLALAGCKAQSPDQTEETPKPEVQVELATSQRRTIRQVLPVTGTLSPLLDHESKVSPQTPGRVLKTYFKVGQQVSKGQVLAQLDPGPLRGQADQASAAVRSAQESLKQAHLNFDLQTRNQASAITLAKVNLRAQQVALEKLLAGARPQELAQAEANVTSAQAALTNAEQNLTRSQTLFGEGLLARKDLEAAQAQETSAQAGVRSAQEALSLTKAGSRSQDIESARISVRQAEEGLRAAEASNLMNNVKLQDVQISQRQLSSAQGAFEAANAQLAAMTIRAPVSGTVEGRSINVGEWVDTSGSICTIADLAEIRLLLSLPASEAGEARSGQAVEFTSDENPGRLRVATVSIIGKAVDPSSNTVSVEAITANGDRSLRDDGFIHGNLIVARHESVVAVPSACVVDKDGQSTVFTVDKDDVAHATKVTTGLSENGFVEVGGLQAGAKVVSTGAYELEDGTHVKPPEKGSSSKE